MQFATIGEIKGVELEPRVARAQEPFGDGTWNNNINNGPILNPIPREDFPYPTQRPRSTSPPAPPASPVPPPPPPQIVAQTWNTFSTPVNEPVVAAPTPNGEQNQALISNPSVTQFPTPNETSISDSTYNVTSAPRTTSSAIMSTTNTGASVRTTVYVSTASSTSRPFEYNYVSSRSLTSYSIRSSSMLSPDRSGSSSTQPIHLSQAAIALLLSLGGVLLLLFSAVITRCVRMQIRRHRRKAQENAFDNGSLSEKGSKAGGESDAAVNKPKSRSLFSKSPSSVFGGRERTGISPLPSWTTFQEGITSPYPLGLVPPPPSAVYRVPSLRDHQRIGLGVIQPGMHIPTKGRSRVASPKQMHSKTRILAHPPPTITITSSSPRETAPLQALDDPPIAHSQGVSPENSFNRVSIFNHPVYGAQLVKPPKLMLANGEASASGESDGPIRASGWSSWDDNVGLELGGMKIDRTIAAKAKASSTRSRVAHPSLRRGTPLDTVPEFSGAGNSSQSVMANDPTYRSHSLQRSRMQSTPPRKIRHGMGSSISTKSSTRSPRSPNSRRRQPPDRLLYDLPQFDALSPNVNKNIPAYTGRTGHMNPPKMRKTRSGQSSRNSRDLLPFSESSLATPGSHSCRHSNRSSGTSSKRTSALTYTPPSVNLSQAVVDVYTYAGSLGDVSEGGSEESQARQVVKRRSTYLGHRTSDHLPRAQTTPVLGTSPNPHARVGTLMLTDYGEEGSIPKGVSSPVITRGLLLKKIQQQQQQHQGLLDHLAKLRIQQPLGDVSNTRDFASGSNDGRPVSDASRRMAYAEADQGYVMPTPALSDQSYYSNHPDASSPSYRHQIQSRFRDVPSLPPPGGPTLNQLRMIREDPDYRSPTYSMYGFYRDSSRVSPLQSSPGEFQQYQFTPNSNAMAKPVRYLPPSQIFKVNAVGEDRARVRREPGHVI
ncbi:hypothetical protein FRB91_001540 [Serendipita sp. 411]|nr:hypothetical protein FRB91_001540 [Serendipita sp. 411]